MVIDAGQEAAPSRECSNASGNLCHLLAVPGQCLRTPGGLGGSNSVPMKETKTLSCLMSFLKTTSLGVGELGF